MESYKPHVLRIDRINPHCGCAEKGFYVLFKKVGDKEEVMGSDEFTYKDEEEFQKKVEEIKIKYNAEAIIN
jgi:hypothetical protein